MKVHTKYGTVEMDFNLLMNGYIFCTNFTSELLNLHFKYMI